MSLLDNLVNTALNSGGNQSGATSLDSILKVASSLLQQGGIQGLLTQFQQAGLGPILQSWIGTGQNAAISGAQITQVLGSGQLANIAQQLGVDQTQASNLLAQHLPQLIDHLTPNGQIPQGNPLQGNLMDSAMNLLKGKLLG